MDRQERVLGMGYLIKSPVKSKDKANFPHFWRLRWFVLAEVLFAGDGGVVEESKLVFSYFKDKSSHQKDEQPKGTVSLFAHFQTCVSLIFYTTRLFRLTHYKHKVKKLTKTLPKKRPDRFVGYKLSLF